jgi:hypothetical protein
MDPISFAAPENWNGPSYELAISLLHDTVGRDAVPRAARILWAQPQLQGPWLARSDYPDPLKVTNPREALTGCGLVSLPDGQRLGCEVVLIPEREGDWLDLCLPLGMVEAAFEVRYERAFEPWMGAVNQVFVQVADAIFHEVPFNLALIGEEVSGSTDEHRFRVKDLESAGFLLSPEFCRQAGVTGTAVILPSGLRWFPPPAERGAA